MEITELEKQLGYDFKDKNLLKTAFTHRSYLNEHNSEKLQNNERLEFLGDAVLSFVVSRHLYEEYPDHPEGDLTNFRAAIVQATTLANVSRKLGLGNFLLLSRGEEASGGRDRQYLLANTFESLLGAIYLDQGVEAASKFVHAHIIPLLADIIERKLFKDSKSQLQELTQEVYGVTPFYEVVKETGPDHSKTFEVAVFVKDKKFAQGSGNSKQTAEQEAARTALEKWDELV